MSRFIKITGADGKDRNVSTDSIMSSAYVNGTLRVYIATEDQLERIDLRGDEASAAMAILAAEAGGPIVPNKDLCTSNPKSDFELVSEIVERAKQLGQLSNTTSRMFACGDDAENFEKQGKFDEAILSLKEQERLARDQSNYDELACSLFSQAMLLSERFARHAEAHACAQEALILLRSQGRSADVSAAEELVKHLQQKIRRSKGLIHRIFGCWH